MKKTNERNKLMRNRVLIVIIMIIFISVSIVYVYKQGIQVADYSANQFYDFYFEEKSIDVKTEVETHLASIQYEWDLVYDLELGKVKHEILHLSDIMKKSYLIDIADYELRREETVRFYKEIVEFDEDHLFFLLDTKGTMLSAGSDNTISGKNMIDAKDVNGTYVIRSFLESIDHKDGIITSYYWPKEVNGEPKEKVSFCYYIPELDVIVGAGVYLEDIFESVKRNVYRRLNEYYRDKENYVFIYTNDGRIEVGPTIESIGSNSNDIVNSDGQSIHELFMSFLDGQDSGFVDYHFTKKDGIEELEKVSYISKIDGWDAYIGLGFYTEDINLVYKSFEEVSRALHYTEIMNLGILLLVMLLIAIILSIRGTNIQHRMFKNEEAIYSVLFEQISDGIIVMVSGNIAFSNPLAEEYLGKNIEKYIKNGKLDFITNKDGLIESDVGEFTYFLDIITKKIYFKSKIGQLYLIKNISKSYEELKEYKHLSTIDELTDLPNRRMLRYDCENLKKAGNFDKIIGLIDIDGFKDVNDIYGHDIGDLVLIELATVFKERLRKNDRLYRYGGEEFVVMIDAIPLSVAADLLMEINALLSMRIEKKFGFSQTFSGGIVSTQDVTNSDLDEIIRKADELLYNAKSNGRNQIKY